MKNVMTMGATEVRRDWSTVIDATVRNKPTFIKRTRDFLMLSSIETIESLVADVKYVANIFKEDDGSITLSMQNMDIVVNAENLAEAKRQLVDSIIDYAEEYYQEYETYSVAPNRKSHLPYIIKALVTKDLAVLERAVVCQAGKT